jgi:hypothetical protein
MVAMSNNNQDWYDDDDDFDGTESEQPSSNDVVSKLRKAERTASKRVKELEAELESLRKFQRDATVSKVLSEKGVNPKIAAFIPKDLETTPEAVSSWLEEYGDVFGVAKTTNIEEVDTQNLAALRQIDAVTNTALSPDMVNDANSMIDNASSAEELINFLYKMGAE